MFKVTRALLCILIILAVMAGCTQDVPTSSTSTGGSSIKTEDITVGFSIKNMHSPFYIAVEQAMQDLAVEKGFEIISVNAGGDAAKQQSDIEDLVSRKVDILIVDSQDPEAIVAISKNVAANNIPMVLINTSVNPTATYVTLIQSDNMAIGRMVGDWAASNMRGEIKIGLLSGNPGNMVGYNRRSGFIQGLTERQLESSNHTNFSVLTQGWGNWSIEDGLSAAEDMLVAAPDINFIFAENDSMAMGAVTAIRNAGKEGQITVAGIDGMKDALKLVQDGAYGASGLNSPTELARMGVETALDYLAGNRDIPKLINTTPGLVHSGNVDQYYDPNSSF